MIDEGEHGKQDFKFCISDSKKIAKSLVAFANTHGGRLLIGVKDNGKIAGVSSDEEFYMIETAAKIYSKPPISFTTKQWIAEGKTVLEINIDEGKQKPYYAKDANGKWLAYIRRHDENCLAHPIQLEVWKKQNRPSGIQFTYSDDEKFLIDYLNHHEEITLSTFMRKAQISRKNASEILSNFIVIGIVEMQTNNERTVFKLNQQFDQNEIDLFIQ